MEFEALPWKRHACFGLSCGECGGLGYDPELVRNPKDLENSKKGWEAVSQYLNSKIRDKKAADMAADVIPFQKRGSMNQTSLTVQDAQGVDKKKSLDLGAIESVFIKGDISKMNEVQRVEFTRALCQSLGLNPLTNPFDYISFQGRIQLYAKKGCTDQLRFNHHISIKIVSQDVQEGVLTVTAQARFPDGREDEDIGSVTIQGLKGDALANAKMKAVTKAKRRVTLSICGLGMLDESETETLPNAVRGEKVFEQPKTTESPKIETPQEPFSDVNMARTVELTKSQVARLYAIAKEAGITEQKVLKQMIFKDYGHESTLELTRQEYEEFCTKLEKMKVQVFENDPRSQVK